MPILLKLLVEFGKGVFGHVHLASDFKALEAGQWSLEAQGDTLNGAQILGDIFAHASVTARRSPHENPALIQQGHAETVDFRLDHIAPSPIRNQPLQAFLKFPQRFGMHRVIKAQHRHCMLDGFKSLGHGAADALGGRIRGDELGMSRFQGFELTE